MAAAIDHWHRLLHARDVTGLDALIADDCIFQSPAIHTPQVGKAVTIKYLRAAMAVLATPDFRYIEQWIGGQSAVLEFELAIDGIHINGVDIIHWNDTDQIIGFRVMVRPIKGLQALMPAMAAVLAAQHSAQEG